MSSFLDFQPHVINHSFDLSPSEQIVLLQELLATDVEGPGHSHDPYAHYIPHRLLDILLGAREYSVRSRGNLLFAAVYERVGSAEHKSQSDFLRLSVEPVPCIGCYWGK